MIYFSIPWSTEKNIGKAYNDFMELLPSDDDFACFLDGDATFLHPFFGVQLEEVIKANPDCGIFTCTTNRIACRWQRAGNWESNDIGEHRKIAEEMYEKYGTQCEDAPKSDTGQLMGGVLILIRKSAWRKIGGFKLGILGVDNELHVSADEHGEKLMLMRGIYVYHWYRGGRINDTSHLEGARDFPRSETVMKLTSRIGRSRAGLAYSKRSRVFRGEAPYKYERTRIMNECIKKNGYVSYLEIGVQNKANNFDFIAARRKVSVDPDPKAKADFVMGSDEFFTQNKEAFDIIFIDGLHESGQVIRDIINSVRVLKKGGTIFVHDCLPTSKTMQEVPRVSRVWTGDVWKGLLYCRRFDRFSIKVIDVESGIGVIKLGFQKPLFVSDPTYEDFEKNKDSWFTIEKYEKDNLYGGN